MQSKPGPSGVQPTPGPSKFRPRFDHSKFTPEELREKLNPCPPIHINQLPKPAVLDPVAELLHYAVNVHNQTHLQDEETDYAALSHVTGRLFDHCFNMNTGASPAANNAGADPQVDHSNSDLSFGSDDSLENPAEDEFVIPEVHYQPLDSEVVPNTIGARNEVRTAPPVPLQIP